MLEIGNFPSQSLTINHDQGSPWSKDPREDNISSFNGQPNWHHENMREVGASIFCQWLSLSNGMDLNMGGPAPVWNITYKTFHFHPGQYSIPLHLSLPAFHFPLFTRPVPVGDEKPFSVFLRYEMEMVFFPGNGILWKRQPLGIKHSPFHFLLIRNLHFWEPTTIVATLMLETRERRSKSDCANSDAILLSN